MRIDWGDMLTLFNEQLTFLPGVDHIGVSICQNDTNYILVISILCHVLLLGLKDSFYLVTMFFFNNHKAHHVSPRNSYRLP